MTLGAGASRASLRRRRTDGSLPKWVSRRNRTPRRGHPGSHRRMYLRSKLGQSVPKIGAEDGSFALEPCQIGVHYAAGPASDSRCGRRRTGPSGAGGFWVTYWSSSAARDAARVGANLTTIANRTVNPLFNTTQVDPGLRCGGTGAAGMVSPACGIGYVPWDTT